ncbi:Bcr/CflA family efflux MFS transporter [Marinomonas agarivorans]|nr:Bcr/CflA family efflux MFS transporter [Marinomonas agarivorans]
MDTTMSNVSQMTKFSMSATEFTILTATLMSIVAISIDALLPALGFIAKDFAVADKNQVQLLISILFLGMALGQLLCGPLSDALGRKPILYGGLAVYFVGTIICVFAQDLTVLIIGRLIQGIGVAGPYISAISLVRDRYVGRDMAKVMSLVMMIFILVPAIAPSIGQLILFAADWHGIFVFYIIYACAIISWIFFRLPETLVPENRIPFTRTGFLNGFKEVLTNKSTTSLIVCIGCVFGSLIGYLNSSQQIFQTLFGTGELFSVYFGILALVLGVSSLANSRLVQKLGMHYIANCAICLIIASSLIFFALHYFAIHISLWMFMLYMAMIFFAFGLLFGNLNALAMEPMGHVAGIASAVIGSVSSLMSITIGTTIGQFYDGTLLPLTIGFLVMSCIALLCLLYSSRQTQNSSENADMTAPSAPSDSK